MRQHGLRQLAISTSGRQPLERIREHLLLCEAVRDPAGVTVGEYCTALVTEKRLAPVLEVIPFVLERRLALWWGCLCVWQVVRRDPSAPVVRAIGSVVRWLMEPSEGHRRAAQSAGEAAGLRSAAGCLAMAAFWCEGSMAPAGLPAVAVPEQVAPQLIGRTVLLAAVEKDPQAFAQRYEQFLDLGLEVFAGKFGLLPAEPAIGSVLLPDIETAPAMAGSGS